MDPAYFYNNNRGRRSDGTEINLPVADQFATELDDFADCIINKRPTKVSGEMGLADVKVPVGYLRVDQEGASRFAGVSADRA